MGMFARVVFGNALEYFISGGNFQSAGDSNWIHVEGGSLVSSWDDTFLFVPDRFDATTEFCWGPNWMSLLQTLLWTSTRMAWGSGLPFSAFGLQYAIPCPNLRRQTSNSFSAGGGILCP
ncbi:hypothetical protein ACA910_001550 [Epithemia clementina (nom. ined.)]